MNLCIISITFSRCVPIENQVPILMQAPFSLASPLENRFKIEAYVESIFEGRRPSGQKLSSLFTENGKLKIVGNICIISVIAIINQ